MTSPNYRQHLLDLARGLDVRVVEVDMVPEAACADPTARMIVISRIHDVTTYAVALHELGHLAAPGGAMRTLATAQNAEIQRREESAAWTWARLHALEWTPVMQFVQDYAEATYAEAPAPVYQPRSYTPVVDWTRYPARKR